MSESGKINEDANKWSIPIAHAVSSPMGIFCFSDVRKLGHNSIDCEKILFTMRCYNK